MTNAKTELYSDIPIHVFIFMYENIHMVHTSPTFLVRSIYELLYQRGFAQWETRSALDATITLIVPYRATPLV